MEYNDIRIPAISILVNGSSVSGVVDFEVSKNSFLGADRYRFTVALDASGYDVWSGTSIKVDISMGLSGSWVDIIQGPVDRVDVDVCRGVVHVEGRDLTAGLIEARTQETFENQTSSDIALLLAARQGLIANVTPTTTLVGREFEGDHSRTTLDQYSAATTEWDLLVRLASLEGFDVWVDGRVLNFSPPVLDPSPIFLTPEDCKSVHLERSLNLSGGLEVNVKSWDCRARAAVSQVASSVSIGGAGRKYVVVRPNLTETAASMLAGRLLTQMSQNSRVVRLERPGDLSTRPRQTLILGNTRTDFDGIYVITSVERRLSFSEGFTETVEARLPPWTAF